MSKKLKVDIRVPSELFGGEYYIIHVDVTNITNQTIDGILVNPHLLPGNLIYEQTVDKEINDLKKQKQQIIGEMQLQVRMARIMTSRERRNFIDRFFIDLSVDL